jgi:hypothetical protein
MLTLDNDQVAALNTLIAVAQRAQARGVLSLDEAAATLAAIRVFVPAPEAGASAEPENESSADDEAQDNSSEE